MALRRYIWNVLVSLDQLGNSLLGGWPDETVSSRSARSFRIGGRFGRFMCWWLNKLEPGHCEKAIQSELTGAQQSPGIKELEKREGP